MEFSMDEIISIDCIGDAPTVDITVEDVHMFYANDIYTHNSVHESDIIEAGDVADSYQKIMIGDFIMSLSRKKEDKMAGTGRMYIMKNRFGPDGTWYPLSFDASCGKIDLYEQNSVEANEIISRVKTVEDQLKEIFKKSWNENKKKQSGDNSGS